LAKDVSKANIFIRVFFSSYDFFKNRNEIVTEPYYVKIMAVGVSLEYVRAEYVLVCAYYNIPVVNLFSFGWYDRTLIMSPAKLLQGYN